MSKYECNKDKSLLDIKKVNYSVLRVGGSLASESGHSRLASGNSWAKALEETMNLQEKRVHVSQHRTKKVVHLI